MKTLFLECNMGATDTMLLSALYDACELKASFMEIMNEALAPFSITLSTTTASKCGVYGTRITFSIPNTDTKSAVVPSTSVSVKNKTEEHLNYLLAHAMQQHEQEHALQTGSDIETSDSSSLPNTLEALSLPAPVKEDVIAIYRLLNETAEELKQPYIAHLPFHNAQEAERLATIIGCALLIYMMAPEQIICSPLHVGSGFTKHGDSIVSVPDPLTAALLKNIPCYTSTITGALLDTTNIAILKYFTTNFSVMPAITIHHIGYGIGSGDFAIANYIRAFYGNTEMNIPSASPTANSTPVLAGESEQFSNTDTILSISCNVDDMTGEALSLATEILLAAGALDVYTTSIQMKKNRPGVLLTCLCEEDQLEKFIGLFFLHTSTQEVRYCHFTRAKLESTVVSKHSAYGSIRVKKSSGYGVEKEKPDFEDLKSIVLKNGITIADISFDE